jgi:DNA-binding response OmpR family regulator
MSNERILAVGDERVAARGLAYGVGDEGFEVLLSPSGEEALELARSPDLHLIQLDIGLPDISRFDVYRQLREEGLRQPIVMVTTDSQLTPSDRPWNPGCAGSSPPGPPR